MVKRVVGVTSPSPCWPTQTHLAQPEPGEARSCSLLLCLLADMATLLPTADSPTFSLAPGSKGRWSNLPITHLTLLSSIMGSCFSGISSSLHPARRPELEYLVPNKWDPTCQMPLNSYLNPTYDISKQDLASQKSLRWGPRQILGLRPTMSACTQAEHFSDPQWTEHMPSPLYPKTWTKNMFLRKVSFWISSFTSTPLLSLPTLRKITYDMDAVIFFIFQKSLLSL